jgi:hypothetical protein
MHWQPAVQPGHVCNNLDGVTENSCNMAKADRPDAWDLASMCLLLLPHQLKVQDATRLFGVTLRLGRSGWLVLVCQPVLGCSCS